MAKLQVGINDLATANPELAKQWHPTKNIGLKNKYGHDISTPDKVTISSGQKVWWLLQYDVPDGYPIEHLRGEHFDFEWEAKISERVAGNGCPFLTGKKVWPGFNDLSTTHPELASQWHPTKNENLRSENITRGYDKKVWWYLSYDVPNDCPIEELRGKHFDFEWQDRIHDRTNQNSGCPFLSGHQVWKGFNDLETVNPELAKQWHPIKNKGLKDGKGRDISTPDKVAPNANQKVWWYLPYDVPEDYPIEHLRGKHFDFEWEAYICNRNKQNNECPYLSGKAVWKGFNDLATVNPELAKQWHPTKNNGLKNKDGNDISTPDKVTAGANEKVWWYLPYDVPDDYPVECLRGKHFDFEWQTKVYHKSDGISCPYLSGQEVWQGFNDLATTHPELAEQWHPTKNKSLNPEDIMAGAGKRVWWLLPYDVPADYPIEHLRGKHFDFEWESSPNCRTSSNSGCPFLSGQAVWSGFNDLVTINPELTEQWHPILNKDLKDKKGRDISTPDKVAPNANQKVWWKCPVCRREWQTTISHRTRGNGCPQCSESKGEKAIRKVLEDNHIKFEEQYKFKDRFYKSDRDLLRDDFALFDTQGNVVGTIEYNGEQHYFPVDFAGKGKENAKEQLEKNKERDKVKSDYLKAHNIPQLIIPYTEFDDVESIVKNFIHELSKDYDL